jgi:hypothetical protein
MKQRFRFDAGRIGVEDGTWVKLNRPVRQSENDFVFAFVIEGITLSTIGT